MNSTVQEFCFLMDWAFSKAWQVVFHEGKQMEIAFSVYLNPISHSWIRVVAIAYDIKVLDIKKRMMNKRMPFVLGSLTPHWVSYTSDFLTLFFIKKRSFRLTYNRLTKLSFLNILPAFCSTTPSRLSLLVLRNSWNCFLDQWFLTHNSQK